MVRVFSLAVIVVVVVCSPVFAGDEFAGKWVKTDDSEGGLTRIEISKKDKTWTIQAWAAGGDGEIDQGRATLHLLGDSVGATEMKYGIASWDSKFKDTQMTLRLEEGKLVVESYHVFKDDSGRSNYRSKDTLKKRK